MLAHEKQILEYEKTLSQVKEQNARTSLWSEDEIVKLEMKLDRLKNKVYSPVILTENIIFLIVF